LRLSPLLFASLVNLSGFFLRILLSRSLGPADYGLLLSSYSLVAFFATAQLGLPSAVAKYTAEFKAKGDEDRIKRCIYCAGIGISVLVGIATLSLIFLSGVLSASFLKNEGALIVLRIFSLDMFISSFLVLIQAGFQGFLDTRMLSLLGPLRAFGNLFVALILVWFFGLGLTGAALSYLVSSTLTFAVSASVFYRKYWRQLRGSCKWEARIFKTLLRFGLLVLIGSVSGGILDYFSNIILQAFRGREEVGYYQAAYPLWSIVGATGVAIGTVLFPLTSELWARSSKDELRNLLRHALRLSFAFLLLPVLVLIAFPETVISLLFTQKFLPAAGILRIMAIVPVFYVPWLYLGSVLGGIGKPGKASMAVAAVAALKVLLDFLLVPMYGMKGAAVSTVACYLGGFIIVLLEVRREVSIQVPWSPIVKSLLGAGLALLLIGLLKAQLTLPLLWKTVCVLGPALVFYVFWEMVAGVLSIDDLRIIEEAFF